jgi:hypothetical protein|tara:strand:- start:1310 stop:1825 length:516 start_codon:yes stop_codon:yes gene_type:complete
MKNYLIMLLSLFILGCNNNKPAEKAEKVESDPVTVQLTVVNNTGKELPTHATWGVDAKDVKYTIPAAMGSTYVMKSNTHSSSGTVFILQPQAPENKEGTGVCDPANGNAQQTYGYWNGAAHITADWNVNASNPTPEHHYQGQHWQFKIDVENAGNPMTEKVTFSIVEKCDN